MNEVISRPLRPKHSGPRVAPTKPGALEAKLTF